MSEAESFYAGIDVGVRDVVRSLRDAGFNTVCSCEGGDGHSFPKPTIQLELGNNLIEVEEIARHLQSIGQKEFKIVAWLSAPASGFWTRRADVTLGEWMP